MMGVAVGVGVRVGEGVGVISRTAWVGGERVARVTPISGVVVGVWKGLGVAVSCGDERQPATISEARKNRMEISHRLKLASDTENLLKQVSAFFLEHV
jgi:hypothetical protein